MALGLVIAVLSLELVYRLVALPPDYQPDRHEAALPQVESAIEAAIENEPLTTEVDDLPLEPALAVLTLSRRLALPPRRAADVLPVSAAGSTEPAPSATTRTVATAHTVVALAPVDDAPGLRLTRRIDRPAARVAAVLGAPPAAGDVPLAAAVGPLVADPTPAPQPSAVVFEERALPLAEGVVPVALPAVPRRPPPGPRGDGAPLVAIVIDDMGYSPAALGRLAAMPGPLTLSFLPSADATPALLEATRGRDFELVLHLPMEPLGDANPGPEALMVNLDEAEMRRRIRWAIDRVPGAVGVNNHMGSRFTADVRGLEIVMDELRQRRLFFVDSRTNSTSFAERVARAAGIPTTGRDIFIDHDPTPTAIARQLAAIERFARYTGNVIAIGHPYPTTLAALETWLPTLAGRGFRLSRLSEVLAHRLCAMPASGVEPCGPSLHLVGNVAAVFKSEPAEAAP